MGSIRLRAWIVCLATMAVFVPALPAQPSGTDSGWTARETSAAPASPTPFEFDAPQWDVPQLDDAPLWSDVAYGNSPYFEEAEVSSGVYGAAYAPGAPAAASTAVPTGPLAGPVEPFVEPAPWWKSLRATLTYLPGGDEDFGFTALDARYTVPVPSVEGLTLTPMFLGHWLEGPFGRSPTILSDAPDMPGQLFTGQVEARLAGVSSEEWSYEMAIAPGIYTDGDNTSGDAWRITGRALAFYKYSEGVRIAVGALYLDREDVVALPAGGIMIFPNYDTRIELIFPRPRIAYRYGNDNGCERWIYAAGEFGGGTWAIERETGRDDLLTYSDLRALFGLEAKFADGFSWLAEFGIVFSREVEYASGRGDREFDSAAMTRVGVAF